MAYPMRSFGVVVETSECCRDETADCSLQDAKHQQLHYVLSKAHQQLRHRQAENGADDHCSAPVAVPQGSPEGGRDEGEHKRAGKDKATPPRELVGIGDA